LVLGTVKGDVHDVGKNLVDIILSNNGFKVINIGIKVSIADFIQTAKKYNANALGMSGLLVKSTNEMKANLEELQSCKLNIPVLLGGAALTKDFVDNFCRPIYDGDIFYARDAFDGVIAMQRIEAFNEAISQGKEVTLDTKMPADLIQYDNVSQETKEIFDVLVHTPKLLENQHNYTPPFYGRRDMSKLFNPDLAFSWINHRVLFRQRWGYKKGKMNKEKFIKYENDVVKPLYEDLKDEFLEKNVFNPVVLYAYFPCKSNDTKLEIYDEQKENIIATFDFPRQGKSPHRCLADYFKSDDFDVVAFTLASSGLNITQFEKDIYDAGEFSRYFQVHGLGVELAEACAELVHKQIRLDLNIAKNEKPTIKDVQMKQYQGCRYSPGYAACPDLAMNRTIFDLLKPEEFGIELSETFQIHPEQSTCAIIVPNSEAKYFNV
jgi:5-methyltetrahydrofolate--homocysteine methyltransferase